MIPQLQFADYVRLLPELVLVVFGVIVMLAEPLVDPQSDRKSLGVIALIGALLSIGASIYQTGYAGDAFNGAIHVDTFSIFFHVLIGLITAVVILASFEYLSVQQIKYGEYYGLILLGAVGQMLMSSAVELVLIFIALEISSIATYILAGFRRRVAISIESSVKYFLLGSFATGFFLYGIALMFGATGSTVVYTIAATLTHGATPLAYAGVALMFVGLGFKVASAPFHVWTPDVYEGAPAPVVALMSTGPKAAAFAVLLRVLFATAAPGWFWVFWVSAILTVFMLSLIGIPVTGGFLAKFYVFQAAMQSHLTGLVIVGVINSAIASYYYLRVIVVMYMREPSKEVPVMRMSPGLVVALSACVVATIYLGVLPDRVLRYALQSAQALVR